jgi:tetratricopeptide (TPR) repeat protein
MCQGCVATEINDGDSAREYYSKLLESVSTRISDPQAVDECERLASAHNEMGIACMMWDRIEEARKHFEDARSCAQMRRRDSDTTHSVLMFATANLGLVHWHEANHDEALGVLEKAHEDDKRREVKGEGQSFMYVLDNVTLNATDFRSSSPGRLMHAIGNVKVSLGDIRSGLDWHTRALDHYLKTIGKGHHRTADVYHKLADDYMRLGQTTTARSVLIDPDQDGIG